MTIKDIIITPGVYNEIHGDSVVATYLVTRNRRMISVTTGEEICEADIDMLWEMKDYDFRYEPLLRL